jgi:hypothetical protein
MFSRKKTQEIIVLTCLDAGFSGLSLRSTWKMRFWPTPISFWGHLARSRCLWVAHAATRFPWSLKSSAMVTRRSSAVLARAKCWVVNEAG